MKRQVGNLHIFYSVKEADQKGPLKGGFQLYDIVEKAH